MKTFMNYMPLFNYGCEAIIRGTVKILQHTFENNCYPTFPCYYSSFKKNCSYDQLEYVKNRTRDIENFRVVKMSNLKGLTRTVIRKSGLPWFKVLRFDSSYLTNADFCLSVGGDIFSLSTGDIPWEQVGIAEFCYKKQIPYIIWGATIGPFEDRPERIPLIISLLKRANLILARDSATVNYLAEKGIFENVRKVFDPAFVMDPIEMDTNNYMPTTQDRPILGFNMSPLAGRYTQDKSSYIDEVVKACEKSIDLYDISIVLVPHVITNFESVPYDDMRFIETVYKRINPKYYNHVSYVSKDIGAPQIKYLISKLDFYAGSRMHSTIAALSTGVPTLSIGYSMKAEGLNHDIFGHQDWLLDIRNFGSDAFCKKLKRVIEEKEQIRSFLKTKIPLVKKGAMEAGSYLQEILGL